ncbi:MAG TPA: CmcI family methyltransferase [Candidatus Kapabacteria bacterium]|nr:CmcI family methyltransferase [Candidatus Kapabacteria bacterium]
MLRTIKSKLLLAQKQFLHRLYIGPRRERSVLDEFHKLYYYSSVAGKTWSDTWWQGIQVLKCPLDLWIYQEIIFRTKPDLIIETGTYKGGTAHFFALMCDLAGQGEVVTIDIEEYPDRPSHPRITYLHGSSTDEGIVEAIRERSAGKLSVLAILDSDHSMAHVRREMELYAPLVTAGNYLIVEDTNINGNPVLPESGPGPKEAIDDFLKSHSEFTIDRSMEKLLMTFNPGGYLKRIV